MFRGRANVVKMILSTQACLAQWIENCWFFERRGTSEKISSKSGLHAEEQIWELRGLERCRRRCQRDKTLITFLDTHHHKPSTFLRCRKFDTSYEKWISLFVKCLHFWSKALVAQPKRYSGDYFSLTFGGFPWTDTKKYWIKLFHLIKSSRMASSRINCVSWRSVASTVRSRVRKLRQDSRYNRVECCLRQSTSENRESKIARNINANDISHRRRQRRDIHDSWILKFSAFICRMFAVQTTEINTSIHMEIIRKRTCGPEYRRVQRTAYWMLEWQGNIPYRKTRTSIDSEVTSHFRWLQFGGSDSFLFSKCFEVEIDGVDGNLAFMAHDIYSLGRRAFMHTLIAYTILLFFLPASSELTKIAKPVFFEFASILRKISFSPSRPNRY